MKVDRGPTLKLQKGSIGTNTEAYHLPGMRVTRKKNLASPLGKSLKVLCASISLIPGYENEIGFPGPVK
jgi:hypothetical protein